MLPAVRTRRATTVVPVPSGTGALRQCRRVPLSPLDTRFVMLPPMGQVFLFPAAAQIAFSDVVRTVCSSLAAFLPAFPLLAGEVTYEQELDTISIDCGEDAGVAFVESETDLDFASLVACLQDDQAVQLVPDMRREELPCPVFAVQVTEFVQGSGGIALGVAFNHVAMDGAGFFRFMQMWAASAVPVDASSEDLNLLHDRSLVRFDGDEEMGRKFLKLRVTDLPRIVPRQAGTAPQRQLRVSRRTFTFSAQALRCLKQRFTEKRPEFDGAAAPSTFATLLAHSWVCLALASGFTDTAPVFAVFGSDCRAQMSPPVPNAYVGNCVVLCVVTLSGAELTGADGPALALLAIRDAVTKVKQKPVGDSSNWLAGMVRDIPPGRKVQLVGSPWLPAYAMDFGFGKPCKVEKVPLDEDGIMCVLAGREAGSVQVSVAIAAEKMPIFRKMFSCTEDFEHPRSSLKTEVL